MGFRFGVSVARLLRGLLEPKHAEAMVFGTCHVFLFVFKLERLLLVQWRKSLLLIHQDQIHRHRIVQYVSSSPLVRSSPFLPFSLFPSKSLLVDHGDPSLPPCDPKDIRFSGAKTADSPMDIHIRFMFFISEAASWIWPFLAECLLVPSSAVFVSYPPETRDHLS